jgi:hypothetical protein
MSMIYEVENTKKKKQLIHSFEVLSSMLATCTGKFVLLFCKLVDGTECVCDGHFKKLNELLFFLVCYT